MSRSLFWLQLFRCAFEMSVNLDNWACHFQWPKLFEFRVEKDIYGQSFILFVWLMPMSVVIVLNVWKYISRSEVFPTHFDFMLFIIELDYVNIAGYHMTHVTKYTKMCTNVYVIEKRCIDIFTCTLVRKKKTFVQTDN